MKSNNYIHVHKIIILAVDVVICSLLCFTPEQYSQGLCVSGSVFLLLISILAVFRARNNWCLLSIFLCLLISNYSIVQYYYFTDNTQFFFAKYAHTGASVTALLTLILFNSLLYVLLPTHIKTDSRKQSFIQQEKYSLIISVGFILVLLLILVFAYTRPQVEGERGEPSPLYEYSIILFIIGFYYCGNKKIIRSTLIIELILFAFQNMRYGGRITALQLLIVLLLTNFAWIKKGFVYLAGIVLTPVMVGIGNLRGNFELTISTIISSLSSMWNNKFTLDTAYSAYHTSITFILVKDNLTFPEIMKMFSDFILSMLLGGSIIPSGNLANYTHEYYLHYYGGLLPVYIYFYTGATGVVIIACLVAFYLYKVLSSKQNEFFTCLGIYISATAFRWYLYSPSNLLRGVMLFAIVFGGCSLARNIFKKSI